MNYSNIIAILTVLSIGGRFYFSGGKSRNGGIYTRPDEPRSYRQMKR